MKAKLRNASAAATLAFLWQGPLAAQCALCRTSAAAEGAEASAAVNLAIVVLLLPALALFCSVYWLLFRRGDYFDE